MNDLAKLLLQEGNPNNENILPKGLFYRQFLPASPNVWSTLFINFECVYNINYLLIIIVCVMLFLVKVWSCRICIHFVWTTRHQKSVWDTIEFMEQDKKIYCTRWNGNESRVQLDKRSQRSSLRNIFTKQYQKSCIFTGNILTF